MRFHPVATLFATLPLFSVSTAYADDVFGTDLVAVVPPGPITGSDEVTIRVLARSADGSATTGLKLTPEASAGKASGWQETGEGWYSFRFTPPEVERPTRVDLGLKGRDGGVRVQVLPRATGRIAVTANPSTLILTRSPSAAVTFDLPGAELEDLDVQATSGTLEDLTDMGGGKFSARFVPPDVNYPHFAQITAVSKANPAVFGHGTIVLRGAVPFPVQGEAGSSVILQIEGADFGPVKLTDGSGKVPIVVSPGVSMAKRTDIVAGKSTVSDFDLQLPSTRRLAWVPDPGIPQEGGDLRFVVLTPTGEPDTGATPMLSSPGGELKKTVHLGDGVYTARLLPSAAGVITVSAKLGPAKADTTTAEYKILPKFPSQVGNWPAPSAGTAASVVVVPLTREPAPGSTAELVVAAVDVHGYPIPGAKFSLLSTNGTVPAEVEADASGIARVSFDAKSAGFATVSATSGTLTSTNAMLVTPQALGLTWAPSSGIQGRWEALAPQAVPKVAVAPVEPVADTSAITTGPDAEAKVASIEVDLPGSIRPGAKIEVVARPLSASGTPVPGQTLDFLSNEGTFGPVEDRGDGTYAATFKAPRTRSGELKFTVLNPEGVLGRGTVTLDPEAGEAPTAATKPEASEHHIPKVRIRAGFAAGTYQYAQRPNPAGSGPLLPAALVVGGRDGGSVAPLLGVDANLRAWFVPYVGMDLAFRSTAYGIQSDAFDARDWLVHGRAHLTGRYPFKIKSDLFWVGLQAGFQFDDFLVFKGCLEPGCNVEWDSLLLPGLELGASIGAEFGPVFFIGSYNQGLASATIPYRAAVDADVGVEVHKNVFIDLGLGFVSRQLLVRGADTEAEYGQLSDTQWVGRLSLGVQF